MRQFKVVVAGPQSSGKTEIVSRLAEIFGEREPLCLESDGATVCMDYTYCNVEGARFHFFGTPGLDRFSPVRKSLSKGMDALILVVDSSDPESFSKAREICEELTEVEKVPVIVAANKRNSEAISPISELNTLFNIPDNRVVSIDAKSGEGVDKLFIETVRTINTNQSSDE